jgi:hypothetical protein
MTPLIRKGFAAFGCVALLAVGTAATSASDVHAKVKNERHPVLQQSIRQLEAG